jgi:hypothetical protein
MKIKMVSVNRANQNINELIELLVSETLDKCSDATPDDYEQFRQELKEKYLIND